MTTRPDPRSPVTAVAQTTKEGTLYRRDKPRWARRDFRLGKVRVVRLKMMVIKHRGIIRVAKIRRLPRTKSLGSEQAEGIWPCHRTSRQLNSFHPETATFDSLKVPTNDLCWKFLERGYFSGNQFLRGVLVNAVTGQVK